MAVDAFANEVMADGPAGYWRLGESSGQPANDLSPNGNDGTYNGGITLGLPGFHGGDTAALFDGATGIIRVPNSPSLNPPTITMEAKIRWDGPTGVQQRIVEKESFAGTTQYGLSVQPTGHAFVELRCPTAANAFNSVTATSRDPVGLGTETHLVATYDGNQVEIYVDGAVVPKQSTAPPIAAPIDVSKAGQTGVELELAIGDRMAFYSDPVHFQHGGTRTFKGLIDEVALYPTALSAERVHAHYQSQFAEGASFEYAAKVVCGKSPGDAVARGVYFTAINVHNPSRTTVRLRWKVAVARPGAKAGPVSRYFEARLGPDEALEIDCPDIMKRTKVRDFLKGFVVINCGLELDVVAVYTAGAERGQVATLHTERVPPRRLAMPVT
jgi:Concanavalin A-like lectin/glucanases superfamily